MIEKGKWFRVVCCLFILISFFLVIYIVFIKDWSEKEWSEGALLPKPTSTSVILPDQKEAKIGLSVIPKSKTGVVLVFDLQGILLDVNIKKIMQQIGFSQAMSYARSKNIGIASIGVELTQLLYVVLHKVCGDPVEDYSTVPTCVREWQTGALSGVKLKSIVLQKIEEHPEWFATTLEKELVSILISNMLTPELFVSNMKIVRAGLEALWRYKNQNHTVVAFFNSDPVTLSLLKEKFSKLFNLFDAIIVSCDIHEIKPDKQAYVSFINRKQNYRETVILIESEESYYNAALSYGLDSILITKKSDFLGLNSYPDFAALDKEITKILLRNVSPM